MTEQLSGVDPDRLTEDLDGLTSVFNLSDVGLEVSPGKGWSCRADEAGGITIAIDPDQLAGPDGPADEREIMFAGRHELQHAQDMLDPEWSNQPDFKTLSQTDKFFWNFVHDITIDGRTVNDYRGYREAAPDLYRKLIKDMDVRKQPKHLQLMEGLRFQSVLEDESPLRVSRDVQQVIDGLRNHDGHDLTEILQHKGTSLAQRIALAEKFIKPEFDKLYEEELQNHSQGELENQAGQASQQADMTQSESGEGDNQEGQSGKTFEEQLQEAVEEYQAAGGDDEDHEDESGSTDTGEEGEDEQAGGSSDDQEDGNGESTIGRLGSRIMDALNDLRSEIQIGDENQQPEETESLEVAIGRLGGTVKRELNLRGADAEAYARALIIYQPMIKEIAEIFKKLARIDQVQSRTVYNRQALPEGERLHTGRLPQAYIQGISDIPMDIWRGKERKAPKITRQFNGLDVYLHIDASISMNGSPARHAAEMGLVLTEGLLLARRQQAREAQAKQPDVRLGCMIFAGSTKTVMPLSFSPSGQERATVFTNVKKANQDNTLVCPGLRTIVNDAVDNPRRDVIGIVISDNAFGDNPRPLARSKPRNCLIWNFSLGGGDSIGVGEYAATVNQTAELPANLLKILRYYERQFG